MPTYQYACTECGEPLEAVQKFTDDPLTECPNCHGRLRKVFNSVGIVFKGSGFYRTDSRESGSKKKSSSDVATSSSSSSGTSSVPSSSSSSDPSSASTSTPASTSTSSTSTATKAASA